MNFRNWHLYQFLRSKLRRPPRTADEATNSSFFKTWWFYGVELFPGVIRKGNFPDTMPLPARMLLRNCRLQGMDCLDIGSMEGLIPILMRKQGARSAVATDFNFHCYWKLAALAESHGVDVRFQRIGLLYDLSKKIHGVNSKGFDLINLSGVLYHVFSPLHVLAGLRPLLKKNGLLIVSTNVVERPDYTMEFNNSGRIQSEPNTFWYLSIPMLDYMLRYFQLAPIDCVYYKYPKEDQVRFASNLEAGYIGVVCRAIGDRGAQFGDRWLSTSINEAWEYLLCDQRMLERQAISNIGYTREHGQVSLSDFVGKHGSMGPARDSRDTHLLRLADTM